MGERTRACLCSSYLRLSGQLLCRHFALHAHRGGSARGGMDIRRYVAQFIFFVECYLLGPPNWKVRNLKQQTEAPSSSVYIWESPSIASINDTKPGGEARNTDLGIFSCLMYKYPGRNVRIGGGRGGIVARFNALATPDTLVFRWARVSCTLRCIRECRSHSFQSLYEVSLRQAVAKKLLHN